MMLTHNYWGRVINGNLEITRVNDAYKKCLYVYIGDIYIYLSHKMSLYKKDNAPNVAC